MFDRGKSYGAYILLIRKFSRGFYFRETSHKRSFANIKPSRNRENSLSFTDVGKSCQSHNFYHGKYVLTLFAKIKFSRKFLNLQYVLSTSLYFKLSILLYKISTYDYHFQFLQNNLESIPTLYQFLIALSSHFALTVNSLNFKHLLKRP